MEKLCKSQFRLNVDNLIVSGEYKADGYRWSYNTSFRGYPQHKNDKTLVEKRAKKILTKGDRTNGDKRFQLHMYKLPLDGPTALMVHYVGDHTVSIHLILSFDALFNVMYRHY